MRWARGAYLTMLLVWHTSLPAQAPTGDPRIKSFDYRPDGRWPVATMPGQLLLIVFGAGEHITSVQMSDPASYQVSVNAAQDGVLIGASRPTPAVIMTIDTGTRRYRFDLTADTSARGPYVVLFRYNDAAVDPFAPQAPNVVSSPAVIGTYRLNGDKTLLPASLTDDGTKTFIRWADNQSIPAVFAVEGADREETVNGYMRAGIFTIDRVFDRLIFRIDKQQATAMRVVVGRRP